MYFTIKKESKAVYLTGEVQPISLRSKCSTFHMCVTGCKAFSVFVLALKASIIWPWTKGGVSSKVTMATVEWATLIGFPSASERQGKCGRRLARGSAQTCGESTGCDVRTQTKNSTLAAHIRKLSVDVCTALSAEMARKQCVNSLCSSTWHPVVWESVKQLLKCVYTYLSS